MWNKAVTPELMKQIREARSKGQKNRVLRLIKKMDKNFENWSDKLLTELCLLSHDCFDFFTPSKSPKYPLFSAAFLVANVAVFAAMAAEYPWFQTQVAQTPLPRTFSYRIGPRGFGDFCTYNHQYYTFSAPFLVLWGGRYNPAIEQGDDHRWFTSLLVHSSFQHIFSNMLLFVTLAAPLELKYGTWRMFLLCFVSAVGGAFWSALFEDGCRIVVGASGGVFGVFGLFIADMIVNFESISYPLIRGLLVAGFLIFFLVSVATEGTGVSHLSHFGGLVSGLFPSFLFLPNFVKEDWEVYLPHCGIAVLFVVFFIFPIVIYEHTLPGITC